MIGATLSRLCLLLTLLIATPVLAGPRDDPAMPIGATSAQSGSGWTGTSAVPIARRYLGTNPTKRRSLWCATFLGMVEKKAGRPGTGSDWARSYLSYGDPVPLAHARPGDIVVLWRGSRNGRNGHAGYFLKLEGNRVKMISGNHGGKVGIGTYSKRYVLGARRP